MFKNIIGNDEIKKELIQSVEQNKISHGYLFIGTEGIGKRLIAKEFAKMILCTGDNKYCDKCKSCIEFDSNNNPDFIEIEPDGNSIKIDQIRELQRKIIEAPITSNKKVYIINNADLMTKEAQNCLLKTLEEPPEFVVLILIGSVESNFLNTIKSRSMILKFQDIPKEEIKKYLTEKYDIKNINEEILETFEGSIGKAEYLIDKQELYESIHDIINEIPTKDLIDILKKADIIYKSQDDKFDILEYMNIKIYNKIKTDLRYINGIQIIEETKKRLRANSNYNMCIDNMLFKLWEEMH